MLKDENKSREAEAAVSLYDNNPEEEIIPFFFCVMKETYGLGGGLYNHRNEILSNVI
jgi:hypothetical protein